jgi:hypothetical protein
MSTGHTPPDYLDPKWDMTGKGNEWHKNVSYSVRQSWADLPDQKKAMIARLCERQAHA